MKDRDNKGCGLGKSLFLIPQFIFKSSCIKHDNYYLKAKFSILNKVYADTMFYALMLGDIRNGKYSFIKRNFYFTVATLYFVIVFTFGWIPWIFNSLRNLWKQK